MKLLYIAGPFRGANSWEMEQNIRRAEEVAPVFYWPADRQSIRLFCESLTL